jgi:single-strand DNA-binding protein
MKKYDVVATTGTYQKDGQTKYVNKNVGAVISTQHGFSLVLDASFNPAGCKISDDGKVWLKLFEPQDSNQQQAPQAPQGKPEHRQAQDFQAPDDGFDDLSIPF